MPGLTWRDVRVYENNLRQQLALFTVDPFPLSVALVIDQSMTYDNMTKVNNALAALQGAFTPYDEVSVFTYNNGPKMADGVYWSAECAVDGGAGVVEGAGREPLILRQIGTTGAEHQHQRWTG